MAITPIDIQQHRFKSRMFGYDTAGVDHFLELVAEELERQHKKAQELKEDLARTRAALEEMREREKVLKETLLTAQQMTDELKANARKEAEIIVADAQLRAERIYRDAEERRIQLVGEIQELKRQKISFESSFRAILESHTRLLDLEVVAIRGGEADERLLEEPLPFDQEELEVSEEDFLDPEEGE
jgi:cell division initiation protein